MIYLKKSGYLLWTISLFAAFSCAEKSTQSLELASGDQISYNFHIRPILSDKCFACHGPDANKREADLRLDTEEGGSEFHRSGILTGGKQILRIFHLLLRNFSPIYRYPLFPQKVAI